jgi:hypothetical protein
LWLGFSNPHSEEILQLETTGTSTAMEIFEKAYPFERVNAYGSEA